jgi:hypothetical protein
MPVDGGMASGQAGRATVAEPASPPLDNLVIPLVGTAEAVGPRAPMVMTTGPSDALDLAVERAFSAPGIASTTTPVIRVNDSGTTASGAAATDGAAHGDVATNTELTAIARIATTSGANEPPVEMLPVVSLVDRPSPTVEAAAPITGSGGTFVTAEQAGGLSLANDPPGVPFAVALPPGPLPPAGVAALLTTGTYGPASIAFSTVAGGIALPAGGIATTTAETGAPIFIWSGGSEAATQVSLPAVGIATSGSFRLAPLFTKTVDGFLRIAAGGTSVLGVAPNTANAAIVVEIGIGSLAPSGPSIALGNSGRVPATDSALALAGSGHAAMVTDRDTHFRRNPDVADAAEPVPRRVGDAACAFEPADLTPQRLGLIIDFTPFDRLAVQQTVDQFREQLQRLGAGLSSLRVSMDIAAELLAVAVALSAWIVVPRILRRLPGDAGSAACDDATSLDGISGLAGGTSPEEP